MSSAPLVPGRKAISLNQSPWVMGTDHPDFIDCLADSRPSINVTDHANIRVDWKETPEAHIFKVEIPGLTKEDVQIQVDERKRVLKISGELSKEESVDEKSTYHRLERQHGSFLRRFMLPKNVKLDEELKAKLERGVLSLTIPKKLGLETRIRSIPISD